MFYLFGGLDAPLRLKSFSALTRGVKTTLKIEVEADDPYAVARALEQLAEVQASQPPPKKRRLLALPAPVSKP